MRYVWTNNAFVLELMFGIYSLHWRNGLISGANLQVALKIFSESSMRNLYFQLRDNFILFSQCILVAVFNIQRLTEYTMT